MGTFNEWTVGLQTSDFSSLVRLTSKISLRIVINIQIAFYSMTLLYSRVFATLYLPSVKAWRRGAPWNANWRRLAFWLSVARTMPPSGRRLRATSLPLSRPAPPPGVGRGPQVRGCLYWWLDATNFVSWWEYVWFVNVVQLYQMRWWYLCVHVANRFSNGSH